MSFTSYTDTTLLVAVNQATTTLSAGIDDTQVTIPLTSVASFVSTGGYAWITSTAGTSVNEELIKYTGFSGSDLTGVTRGVSGTIASAADLGDVVDGRITAEMHNAHTTALKSISTELAQLSNGTRPLAALGLEDTSGTIENGALLSFDTNGDFLFDVDTFGLGTNFAIRAGTATAQIDLADMAMDGTVAAWAFDEWKLYKGDDLAGTVGVHLKPNQADGSGVVAYKFDTLQDLANTNANLLRVANQGTAALEVRKVQTRAPKFVATATEIGLSLPVLTTAVGGSVVDGDVYLTDILGVRKLNAKMSGTTYSVTLT